MSKSKQKGTSWETEIVRCLNAFGWGAAERRTLSGALDKGDINMHPDVVIEAKSHGTLKLAEWVAEAEVEKNNANATVGVVWAKRRGKASANDGYVIMTGTQFMSLLIKARYL